MSSPSGQSAKHNASSQQVCIRLDNATLEWIDSILPRFDLNRSDRIRIVLNWGMGFMDRIDMGEVYEEKGSFDPKPVPYSVPVLDFMLARTEREIETHESSVEALYEDLRKVENGVRRLETKLQDKLKRRNAGKE